MYLMIASAFKPRLQGPLGLRETVCSVLAAFFGVQSSANRKRDFTRGSPLRFVVVGVVLTLAFALVLMTVVQVILKSSGH